MELSENVTQVAYNSQVTYNSVRLEGVPHLYLVTNT